MKKGFTLIELSIVLVIIGLIVGGVLVGQDLINAASQRAQISQIEKYYTAVNTFRNKYGYLPGDIPNPYATNFGFATRGTNPCQGDGNGLLQAWNGGCGGNVESVGEILMFWVDLSTAKLIDGGFNSADPVLEANITPSNINLYLPPAKIGNGNYIYIFGGGYWGGASWVSDGFNYYGLSVVSSVHAGGDLYSDVGLTVQQAYNIDSKIDDGMPQSGSVLACFNDYARGGNSGDAVTWAAGGGLQGAQQSSNGKDSLPTTAVTTYATTNCYDNSYAGGVAATQKYQLKNTSQMNCALFFRFQ